MSVKKTMNLQCNCVEYSGRDRQPDFVSTGLLRAKISPGRGRRGRSKKGSRRGRRRGRSKLLTQIRWPKVSRKARPVCVVLENGFAPVPAVHQVVNRPGILHSEFSPHAPSLTPSRHLCQCLGLTPSLH